MRDRRRALSASAAVLCASLVLVGCGNTPKRNPDAGVVGTAMFDDASTRVVNPSTSTGGTLRLVSSDDWDSLDPGNTYRSFAWNFARFFGRTLVTYRDAPGDAGLELVPDLATGLGVFSDGGRTVTYTLRDGVQYEDGTAVVARDVKYAIERSNYAPTVLGNGPAYFKELLGTTYRGPYTGNARDKLGLSAITTPDEHTIVFHLTRPFAEFDHLAALPQTIPVPWAKDTGAGYARHPMSSGPYMVDNYSPGGSLRLVQNPHWDQATDPVRHRLAEAIEVTPKVEAGNLDERLLSGAADLDLGGTGLSATGQARVQSNPNLRKNVDNPLTGFASFVALNTRLAPLDDVHCRRAVVLAADHEALHAAYGGASSGDLATTLLPPTVIGHRDADRYGILTARTGDVTAAKDELKACGRPTGFRTGVAVRADRPKEIAGAQALALALDRIGVHLDIAQFPADRYFPDFAGNPAYARTNNLGLSFMSWAGDWPTGYAFLSKLVDSRAIRDAGNSNLSQLDDPEIDRLLDKGSENPDAAGRTEAWGNIDARVMDLAAVLPIVFERVLTYRSSELTNVFVHQRYGMYDVAMLGLNPPPPKNEK
jgi:peptide/nickel transport system substrate-binding protein